MQSCVNHSLFPITILEVILTQDHIKKTTLISGKDEKVE